MLKKVATEKAPAAIGPYSQGIIANGFLFASGQIPIIPETGETACGDIYVQAEQVMKNVGEILKEAGTDYEKVVKTTCFLAEMSDSHSSTLKAPRLSMISFPSFLFHLPFE